MKKLISTATAMVFALGLAAAAQADSTLDKTQPTKPVQKVAKTADVKDVKATPSAPKGAEQMAQTAAPQKEPAKVGETAKPEVGKAGDAKKDVMEKQPMDPKGKPIKVEKKEGAGEKTK